MVMVALLHQICTTLPLLRPEPEPLWPRTLDDGIAIRMIDGHRGCGRPRPWCGAA